MLTGNCWISPISACWLILFYLVLQCGFAKGEELLVWREILNYPDSVYGSPLAMKLAQRVIFLQRPTGGWQKGIDPAASLSESEWADRKRVDLSNYQQYDVVNVHQFSHYATSIDNEATHTHLRFLLRVWKQTRDEEVLLAINRGLVHLLAAQLDSGAWPQNYPNRGGYAHFGTLNDGAMIGVLWFLSEVKEVPGLADHERTRAVYTALQKALGFILKAQIVINNKHTGWAQQYDGLIPARARIHELPALATLETVGVLKWLMSLESPTPAILKAVSGGVDWLRSVSIPGIQVERVYDDKYWAATKLFFRESLYEEPRMKTFEGKGYDLRVVSVDGVRPIWSRYYDLESMKPFFVGWDGVKRYSIAQIDYPMRVSYKWYWYWPEGVIAADYESWKKRTSQSPPAPVLLQLAN